MNYDEFVRRVGERSGHADSEEAERELEATLPLVHEAAPAGEFGDVLSNPPNEFHAHAQPRADTLF
jgi:hypothetical protein